MELQQDEAQIWVAQGQQQLQWSMGSIALQSFERAIAIDGYCLEAWEGKAEALRQMGRWNEAVEADQKIISLRMLEIRQDSDFYLRQGDAFYDSGRNEEALASYDKAIEIKPDYQEAWYNRGNSLSALGRKEEAIASYDKAIEIKPDDANAFYKRACCHSLMGNPELALEDLTIAFRLDPEQYRQLASTDRDLDPLRALPAFIILMDR